MHFKHQYRIPRPSYLAPTLMPPVDPPGHASWPSGHATEAYLLALCLKDVLPQAAFNPERPHASPLDRVAERIARNREVLGVHYPCDSRAGKQLAEAIFPLLMKCPSLQGLNGEPGVLQLAKDEWKITPIGPL
jgi:membrane-associated phospholipid phosphatase